MNVDLIIPSFSSNLKKYPIPFYRLNQHWFPVWYFLKDLEKKGIKIRFLNYFNFRNKKLSKIVGIDNMIIQHLIKKNSHFGTPLNKELLLFLKQLKKRVDYLIWFDTNDSTGNTQFEVLPYVNSYLKKQLLKNKTLYTRKYYGDTIYIDYYARNYDLKGSMISFPLDLKYKQKINISWNYGLSDYRFSNQITRIFNSFSRKMNLKYIKPSLSRRILLNANFSANPSFKLRYFQRQSLSELLIKKFKTNKKFSFGYLPKKIYINNLKNSKSVLSPFGLGEVCFRDFETFIAGAALIKPDMEHLETWPNIFKKNINYISIPWRIEDFENRISEILSDSEFLFKIACNGQKAYKKLWTAEGRKFFCEHFIKIITPKGYF